MNVIQIKDINLGGISDSILQGQPNSVAEMNGLDIHSTPGLIKVNQRLTKESGVLIDDLVKTILPCSDGNTYFFGSTNGKVWQRTSAGVYSYLVTVAPAAGAVGIMDAREYQGYIHYSCQSRLGRVAVGAPTNWAGRDDNWQTFANTDLNFHPFQEVNAVLYVGDGKDLAQVDAGTYSPSALDIATPLRIKSLGKILTDILIGTFVNVYRVMTEILRWNTWSESYSVSDEVPEIGINCFLKTDNFVLVNAGTKGNFYSYNGSQLDEYKRIPGTWTGSNQGSIYPNASCNMFGLPLFGLSNISGDPAPQGIYSLGGYDRNYPKVLNLEWLISTGRSSGVDIGACEMAGNDLLVAWKNSGIITMTIANPGVVTWTGHEQITGTPIMFTTTGALPTGVTASTYYYIRVIDANTFHLYDTSAHALNLSATTGRVVTSGTQSGVHTTANYGIDILDQTAKIPTVSLTTRIINIARGEKKILSGFVGYRSLPYDSEINIYYKDNYTTNDWTEIVSADDTERKIISLSENMPSAAAIQIKIEIKAATGANVNSAPEIDTAEFIFN